MNLLETVVELAWEAGDKIIEIYKSGPVKPQLKSDKSPVTDADLASDKILTLGLNNIPQSLIKSSLVQFSFDHWKPHLISEEASDNLKDDARKLAEEGLCWLIDPLDGTRDFVARTGDFAVCIALVSFGIPILGVIDAPFHGLTLAAEVGKGTVKYNRLQRNSAPKKVTSREMDNENFVLLVSRFHLGKSVHKIKQKFPYCTYHAAGSAYKYALIADGAADLSVRTSPTSAWDIAAAQCILEEAGGGIIDFEENPLRYGGKSLINPPLIAHGQIKGHKSQLIRDISDVLKRLL